MSGTQPANANAINIYRNIKFTYANGLQKSTVDCSCPCNSSKCNGVDKLFMYGASPSPVKELYTYFENQKFKDSPGRPRKGSTEFTDDLWSQQTEDELLDINRQSKTYNDDGYIKWTNIMNKYTSACVLCNKIKNAVESSAIQNSLNGLQDAYNSQNETYSSTLDTLISKINTQRNVFLANTSEIRQLQKKIRLSNQLLNAQADKIKTFGHHFTSLQAQYKEREMDRVAIGVPYLKPFYTMTSRHFFLMMVVLNIVMVAIICIYGFYPHSPSISQTENINAQTRAD